MTRRARPTPEPMVLDGKVQDFGHFQQPFRTLNIEDVDFLGPRAPRALNRFRLKNWQHFAVFGPDLLFTFVVVDAGYMATSFCYFVDRATGAKVEHHRERLSSSASLARALWNDSTTFAARGYQVEVRNLLEEGRHLARVDVAGGRQPGITAELELHADLSRHHPLEVIMRLAPNRPAWSHKMACPVSGVVRVGERQVNLDPTRHLVLVDIHKAYYPYRMHWTWASCAGFDEDGEVVGVNLTHNVVEDDHEMNENCVWAGGDISMLGAARFRLDQERILEPWKVATDDGRCELLFHPEGERAGLINLGLIKSDYHQPYGTFTGRALDDAGKEHRVQDFFGVTELHRARF